MYAHISRVIWSDRSGDKVAGKVSDPEHQDVRSFEFDGATMDHFEAINRLWAVIG